MAVVNIAFDLAPEIVEGLATGAYKLFGGVVRDQAGRIVCFLPEAMNIAKEAPAATLREGFAIAAPYLSAAPTVLAKFLKKNPDLFD